MTTLLAVWLLCTPGPGHHRPQSGPLVEVGAGVGMTGRPVQAAVAGHASVGWWRGVYDDAYAFGRYWAVVSTTRLDALPARGVWSLAPMLEVRRGIDIFVANPAFVIGGVAADRAPRGGRRSHHGGSHRAHGPCLQVASQPLLGHDRPGGGRRRRAGSQVAPAGGLMLGGGFARPARAMKTTE